MSGPSNFDPSKPFTLGGQVVAAPPPMGATGTFTGNLGDLLIASILKEASTAKLMELSINPETLHDSERPYFKVITDFVRKHGVVPTLETYVRETGHVGLPPATEPPSYYAQKIRDRYIREGSTQTMLNMSNQMKGQGVKSEVVLETALASLLKIKQGSITQGLYDVREMGNRVIPTYQHTLMHEDEVSIHLGWDYIDRNSGILKGDILSWVGRPATGKTWLNLQSAINPWLFQHKRTMFVTTEMLRQAIETRVSAMVARVPVRGVAKANLATPQFQHLRDKLVEISTHDAPFWIVDANMGCNVQDIWALCSMLQVEWLVIDGAYLLTHPEKRLDRFTRVAENCRLLKSEIASGLGIPLAASWQFNREMSKKKNAKGKKGGDEKPTVDDIGFSDEIGQISTLVLATLEAESIETQHRRRIDVLKGRNGETGGFFINWNFNNMDFSEHQQLTHESLKFV